MAKNKKQKLRRAMYDLAEGKEMKGIIMADPQYQFDFKEWLHDNSDEMVISVMSSLLLISFDQLLVDLINRKFFPDDPLEIGKAIYLCGGIIGDMIYRAISKMRTG